LSKDEVDKMKRDASEHAADDKKKKEAVEIRNQADNLVFQTKKQMEEMKDKLSADSRSKLESAIKTVEDAIASNNSDQMKSATESLNKVWNEVASELYQKASQQEPGPQEPGKQQPKSDEKEVQDASYEVVDEEKEKNKKK
jgi:molecular chaperone DnaK